MTYKEMLDMELNSKSSVDDYTIIIRVPGGWIYRTRTYRAGAAHTFIPEEKAK